MSRAHVLVFALTVALVIPTASSAATTPLSSRLAGRIVLQVQARGEAWYIDPIQKQRFYLGTANDAYALMRSKGLGIRHAELTRYLTGRFPSRLSGRILLDIERRGEAYYVDPVSLRGTYLGRASDAYSIMRRFGLGITDTDLAAIPVATGSNTSTPAAAATTAPVSATISALERQTFDLINAHRRSIGVNPLTWNDKITEVARAHSQDMASGRSDFGHGGFSDRLTTLQKTITVRSIAENVALNDYPNPAETAVNGWIESNGHRVNLENAAYTMSGMGVAQDADGTYYFTQLFVK